MYLQGILTIDPAQLTYIDRVQPTNGFAKMAYFLTGGIAASKEERETFCAVTILQQINKVMRSVGVDNVVRLATDSVVFYEDTVGAENDLKDAMEAFTAKACSEDISYFNELSLVLEHHLDDMACLIDIRVKRTHKLGEHPMRITLNGLPSDLNAKQGEDQMRSKLSGIFSSQSSYDDYLVKYQDRLAAFLDQIEAAFQEYIKVDHVSRQTRVKIVRPKTRVNSRDDFCSRRDDRDYYDPIYHGYYGYHDAFYYSWLWSDMMHENNIHCHDCVIVDEQGDDVFDVGEEGFVAGVDNQTLNVDEPFDVPTTGDLTVHDGHDYSADIDTTPVADSITSDLTSDGGGGWLSGIADSFSDSFSGGDDGGSASSCGSSCGGCGGD